MKMNTSASIAKTGNFRVEVQIDFSAKTAHLKFFGELTEESDLEAVWSYLARAERDVDQIVCDTRHVDRINSAGLMLWMKLIKRVQARMRLKFSKVSVAFIAQASEYSGLLGAPGTEIESFAVPYRCASCGAVSVEYHEVEQFLAAKAQKAKGQSGEIIRCGKCPGALELDDIESVYFRFLENLRTGRGKSGRS